MDPNAPTAMQTPDAPPPADGPEETMPLGKWLVPFFVIPLVIVISVALIFLLFGMLTAEEKTPRQNLQRVVHGGRNDRKQGAFELQRQLQNLDREKIVLDSQFAPDLVKAFEELRANKDADVELVCLLAASLGVLHDERAIPALTAALDDSRSVPGSGFVLSVQWYAAYGLATLATPETLSPLLKMIRSEDEGLRKLAALGLGRMDRTESREALRAALEDPKQLVRWTAAQSLAGLGDPIAVAPLRELLDAKNAALLGQQPQRVDSIRAAIEGLVALKDRETIPLLKKLDLEERDPKIRDLARKGILKLESMKP